MKPISQRRSGFALPVALAVLTIVGLFIAGTAFAAIQESRGALGSLAQRAALEAAEYGVAAVVRDWSATWNTTIAIGSTIGPTGHSLSGGATASVRITRVTPTTWWVVSHGRAGGLLAQRSARRTVNAIFRLDIDADSALGLAAVSDSLRMARLGFAVPVRVRDRWWQQF
jgi:hypothetical protein